MGLLLIDKTADFSASPVGYAGLYTSQATGLLALHEIRRNAAKTDNNAVPNQPGASVLGAPTFNPTYATVDVSDYVVFGVKPAVAGSTLAIIVQNKTGGTSSDGIVGSVPGASSVNGAVWFTLFNRRLTLSAYSYAHPYSLPLSGFTNPTVFMDMLAGDDGNFELFFGILEDNVSMRIYRPKTKATVTTTTVGRDFAFDSPALFQTNPIAAGGAQNVSAFGYWNAVLTPTQMDTVYGELKQQFANIGLSL